LQLPASQNHTHNTTRVAPRNTPSILKSRFGLLGGVAASFAVRGIHAGAVGMPTDLAGYLFVLAVSGWGFGVIYVAASSKWALRAAWLLAPIMANGILGAAVGLQNEPWLLGAPAMATVGLRGQ
jgi:hypothetical protein